MGVLTRSGGVRRQRLGFALAAATSAFIGCATVSEDILQYQDERTAVTVTVATRPVVLAREVPVLAANARDYISLTAVEVNRTGQRRYYLFGYRWSTIDRGTPGHDPAGEEWVLQVDDRILNLKMSQAEFSTAGLSRMPVAAPAPGAAPVVFPTDRATLEQIAAARRLSARLPAGPDNVPAEPYRPWDGSSLVLTSFFSRTAPPRAALAPSGQAR